MRTENAAKRQGSSPLTAVELGFLLGLKVNECPDEASEFSTLWRLGVEPAPGKCFHQLGPAIGAFLRRLVG
jgi:hypothetical protein